MFLFINIAFNHAKLRLKFYFSFMMMSKFYS